MGKIVERIITDSGAIYTIDHIDKIWTRQDERFYEIGRFDRVEFPLIEYDERRCIRLICPHRENVILSTQIASRVLL